MDDSGPLPRLRLLDDSEAARLTNQLQREAIQAERQRENELEQSLQGFRVGSVPFLNAVPLTRGLEDQIQFVVPSKLGAMMHAGELDAALLSVTEALLHPGYAILDGIAIASLGEVQSVFLAHRGPLEAVREIHCDPASLTSVQLLKVLLAERGLTPAFQALSPDPAAPLPENVLLIGDRALDLIYQGHDREIWDLGAAWYELTGLPFVYAVWVLRQGQDQPRLRQQLREARDFGLDTIDHIIASRTEYDADFRRDYLTWHVHYHLGADEKRGLRHFAALLRKHLPGPVYEPVFV